MPELFGETKSVLLNFYFPIDLKNYLKKILLTFSSNTFQNTAIRYTKHSFPLYI